MAGRVAGKIKLQTVDELLGVPEIAGTQEIELGRIHAFPNHPIKVLDDERMDTLVESIRENGILNPVIVRPDKNGDYEMISGHRRLHAAGIVGLSKIPAIVKEMSLTKYKAEEREIWTAEMLMQAINACENKWLKVAFHLAFAATVRIGELLGLTWDCVDVSEEAIAENRAYIFINKQVERVSRNAVDELDSKEVILIFPSQRKNNKTVRLLKTPKTDTSERKVYIPKFVAQILVDIKKEQDELKDILGSEYQDYNLVMATTFGLPIGDSYLRDQMQKVIDEQGLPDVVFHSLRHTSVTYKLKLSGGDIKAVQGDSGHAQADMVTEVYGHIIDEDRRKNAQRMEDAFYNRENLNPQMKGADADQTANTVAVPEGVDAELLMKVLGNLEMAALLTSLAKSLKAE